MLGKLTTAVGEAAGDLRAIDIVGIEGASILRELTIQARDSDHAHAIVEAMRRVDGVEVLEYADRTFALHQGGKISVVPKVPIKTRDDLSMAYTPGVARVCRAIAEDPKRARTLTIKRNMVAVVTDGSAVLGLGNLGPEGALPVMDEVRREAAHRKVELLTLPTREAIRAFQAEPKDTNAILHVTC